MSELPPSPEAPAEALRDRALYTLATNGWAEETEGVPGQRIGWFAYMSNADVELPELMDVLSDPELEVPGLEPSSLIGHFLITERQPGDVSVHVLEDRDSLEWAWRRLSAQHDDQLNEERGDDN